ncbi:MULTISPECIES: hypothetical protein [unclassified Streptomyces]|uniref:hypothetical protein n=1 Tax=unclassified Streptomyces TaxID=2593676 RepID=UPI000DC7BF13|nr:MULTISPECIES: hypothetical protein [unclassified Streptomyces]AWZ07839.1 hypothetical protein DRB89_28130 [Streptomyces sp. ICC4]AWZ13453.1 hypothetical protein DRB96_15275 [Streptomyces sp. ICC1]
MQKARCTELAWYWLVENITRPSPVATGKPGKAAQETTVGETCVSHRPAGQSLTRLPLPWWTAWRALDKAGATRPRRPVVFECVGTPGMLDGILAAAPMHARVVVVGVCMGSDRIRPSLAVNKELDLRFAVGYTPLEFRDTLHALADGTLDTAAHLVTGRVGLAGVPAAFTALDHPEAHAKILIDPALATERIQTPHDEPALP